MRHLLPAGLAAAAIAATAWAFWPAPQIVETAIVSKGELTVAIEAEGEASIREVVVVSAPMAGLLQRITLHAGDDVAAGQSVAQIGPMAPALLDSRARAVAEATAAAAAAAVDLARSQLEQAEAAQLFRAPWHPYTELLLESAALRPAAGVEAVRAFPGAQDRPNSL